MEKKVVLPRKTNPNNQQQREPESATYKNENVIFKIHSARGEENYNGKTFPAKFSINICNEPTELTSGLYNRDVTQQSFAIPNLGATVKNQFQAVKTQRVSPNFDFDQYDKQIKGILQDKKKCDELIRELEETCEEYQYQNQDLRSSLNQASLKLQDNQQKINELEKNEQELDQYILKLKHQNKELKHKLKYLEHDMKKQRQLITDKATQQSSQINRLQKKIVQLEEVIEQKQKTIKNVSNFNNQIAKKMLDEQSYSSTQHVRRMEKWLKLMNKKYQNQYSNSFLKESQRQNQQDRFIAEMMLKGENMQEKICELEKLVHYFDLELKKALKDNQNLVQLNERLKLSLKELEQGMQKQSIRETQQSFYRKTSNSNFSHNQSGTIVYEGTVKVKMEILLIQKDKRINALEQELMQAKKQNAFLRTQIYQLDVVKDSCSIKEDYSLKKAKSLQNFYQPKNGNLSHSKNDDRQLHRIMSQCNDLTETLGNFMQTYKSQRPGLQQRRRSRFSYSFQPNFDLKDENKDKIKQLIQLQKATYEMLQKNFIKEPIGFQQIKWNRSRQLDVDLSRRQKLQGYQLQNPATQRLSSQNSGFRRTQRCKQSCFLSQDR